MARTPAASACSASSACACRIGLSCLVALAPLLAGVYPLAAGDLEDGPQREAPGGLFASKLWVRGAAAAPPAREAVAGFLPSKLVAADSMKEPGDTPTGRKAYGSAAVPGGGKALWSAKLRRLRAQHGKIPDPKAIFPKGMPDGDLPRWKLPKEAALVAPPLAGAPGGRVLPPAVGAGGGVGGGGAADDGGAASLCTDCPMNSVSCGETVRGDLAPADCDLGDGTFVDVWRLELAAAQQVRLRLTSEAFDTFLVVEDAACEGSEFSVVNDDCGDGTLNSCTTAKLPAGTYFLFASSFYPAVTGPYELQVTCEDPPPSLCESCVVGEIACGQKVQGDLAPTDCDFGDGSFVDIWRLELAANRQLHFSLTSPGFDTFLVVDDEYCALSDPIVVNDDCSAAALNSCATATVPAGTYFVFVSSFSAGVVGPYEIKVTCEGEDSPVDPPVSAWRDCIAGEVSCGATVQGELSVTDCENDAGGYFDVWRLELAEDREVIFNLTSQAFETYLFVAGVDYLREGWLNTDCGDTWGTLDLWSTAALRAGTYFLLVTSGSGRRGPYQLRVTCCDPMFSCRDCVAGYVPCNGAVQGDLRPTGCDLGDGSLVDIWRFELMADREVTFHLTSEAFDTFLFVGYAADDELCLSMLLLISNIHCADGSQGACASAWFRAGAYFVFVSSFQPAETGPYELQVTVEDCPPSLCERCVVGEIHCGETVQGDLAQTDCDPGSGSHLDIWRLDLTAEREVIFNLSSESFIPSLAVIDELCGFSQVAVANDNCGGRTQDFCATARLPAGTYFVFAGSYDFGETGPYQLRVSCWDPMFSCRDCVAAELPSNDTIQGELSPTDCDLGDGAFVDIWRLELAARQQVSFDLRSQAYNTFLVVTDEFCALSEAIVVNDDCSAGNPDSCATATLRAGTYFVFASSRSRGQTGPYELRVTCRDPGTFCRDCLVGDLPSNGAVQGELSPMDCNLGDGYLIDVWRLELTEEQEVRLDLTSAAFNTYLTLEDDACLPDAVIAYNDDCGEALNSCLNSTLLPGTYFIFAKSFWPGQTGPYELRVTCRDPGTFCRDCLVGDLPSNGAVQGELSPTDCDLGDGHFIDVWRLQLETKQEVRLDLISSAFNAFLAVEDKACVIDQVIAANNDCGATPDSCLNSTLLPGTYFIFATSLWPGRSGPYELRVTCRDPVMLCRDCLAGELPSNGAVQGELSLTDCDLGNGSYVEVWRLEVAAEQTVHLKLTSAAFESFFFVLEGNCALELPETMRETSDLCGDGKSEYACRTMTLPTGTYFVLATSLAPAQTGGYRLEVNCWDPLLSCRDCVVGDLACNGAVRGEISPTDCDLGDSSFVDIWRLELVELEKVSIRLTSPAFDSYLRVEDETCRFIADADNNASPDSSLSIRLPAGIYFVYAASNWSGGAGSYQLEVTCTDNPVSCLDCLAGDIACGGSVQGSLAAGDCQPGGCYIDAYLFDLAAEQQVTIRLSSAGFEPYLTLQDSTCLSLAIGAKDDCGPGDSSVCISRNLRPGSYVISASSAALAQTGAYQLEVTCTDNPVFCRDCLAGDIACGQTLEGELTAADCDFVFGSLLDVYRLELAEAREVTVNLSSGAFDTLLGIADADCWGVAGNNDCPWGSQNSCATVNLPAGTYFVFASSYTGAQVGPYQLHVSCGPSPFPLYVRGDANADGGVNISDAISTLSCLFLGGACPTCSAAADSNWSGRVDLSDAIYTLAWLFLGGPPPLYPAPSRLSGYPVTDCGIVDDDLDCASFAPCEGG